MDFRHADNPTPFSKMRAEHVAGATLGFVVTLNVVDQGDFDPATVRDALIDGIRRAENEGHLTRLGDETTTIELVSVKQAIGEAAQLQFIQQIARLTLPTEKTQDIESLESDQDALAALIREARRLVDDPASTPRRGPKP